MVDSLVYILLICLVILVGNSAINAFYNEENITRADPPPNMLKLLTGGERNAIPFLEGQAHQERRDLLFRLVLHLRAIGLDLFLKTPCRCHLKPWKVIFR